MRRRRGPLHRPRRARADRGRLRAAARGHVPQQALEAGRAADPRRQGGPGPTTASTTGRPATRRPPSAPSPRPTAWSSLDTHYPRCHPAPLECCGCVADVNPATGQATIYMTSQAPHVHPHGVRARRRAARAEHPDHLARHRRRLRQQGARLPRLRRGDGGVAADRPAGEVGRGPHRQPDLHGLRARLPHEGRAGASRGRQDARISREDALRPGLRLRGRAAEQVQGRAVPHRHGLLRHPRGARRDRRRVHEQGAGRRRLPLLVPRHRGLLPDRAARPVAPPTSSSMDPAELRRRNFIQPEQFPYASATGFVYDSGDYEAALDLALEKLGYAELREEQRAGARGRPAARHRASPASPRSSAPGPSKRLRHPRDQDVRLGRAAAASHGQGDPQARRQVPGPRPRDDVRPDRRRGARHPARRHRRRRRATPTHTPYGLGTYAARAARPPRARPPPSSPASCATRRRRSPRTCSRRPRRISSGSGERFSVKGAPSKREDDPGGRPSPPTRTSPRAWRPASKASTTTTRRT